ncbi:hypothetical protein N9H19_00855 [Flavobacteriales bacterium]|nr:hypothetical protein [Flavobacteriales bacterium]
MSCIPKIIRGFVQNCDHTPKSGTLKGWIFNYDDIDRGATQIVNKATKITDLVLQADKNFYVLGAENKSVIASHESAKGENGTRYTHTALIKVPYRGENERQTIQELALGSRVGVIIQKLDGGVSGELSFEVYGFESGMLLDQDNFNTSENDGVTLIGVKSYEGEEEGTANKLLLHTDYATTLAYLVANEA